MSTMSIADWVKKLEAMAGGGLAKVVKRNAKKAGLLGEREAKLAATLEPRVRSGRLRSSIRHELRETSSGGLELVLRAGGGGESGIVNYAGIQEYGGTIRPTRAKNLAIPLDGALTGAGVPRWPGGPRGAPMELGLAMGIGKRRLFLVDRATGEPMYLLVKSVTVRGKHFMRKGQAAARDHLLRELARSVRATVDATKPGVSDG